ncbi:PilZ domain-containing protein [Thalassotalea sp. 1_MG-2023]|uniref:PilZ domain-containing protein n=1 Tax=Thalassotalea sp. 1_MG-2023 TaxID=3062680 RepID=UPI0026E3FCE2|nr:PilZ domain-containing protein [Thalassotalea sp. 1_MG-2023]MDO6426603.1 PilZ domain-containing protein [Thalassotalea sp. 1_MG-2023]
MTTTNQDKHDQFNEFFSIAHNFTVNVTPLNNTQVTSYQNFLDAIPTPFLMASEISSLDQAALKPLQALSGVAGQLIDYLNHQARKIDLLMGYIVQQQDESNKRYQGVSFGGGGFTFVCEQPFAIGTFIEVKLFIPTDNCAIYCYGEIINHTPQPENETTSAQQEYQVVYHFIRDEDRDALVRASLHKQAKDLQALAAKRKQKEAE